MHDHSYELKRHNTILAMVIRMITAGHSHKNANSGDAPSWIFKLGVFINLSFFIAGLIMWQLSGSVAVLSDSFHNAFHAFIHIIALWGDSLATKPPTDTKTYGQRRRQVLASFLIGLMIVTTAIFIVVLGILRTINPKIVLSEYMIILALLDILSDILLAGLLMGLHYKHIKISKIHYVKAVLYDIRIDAMASVGVLISAILILTIGFYRADGIAAIPIALIAAWLAHKLLKRTAPILLDEVPKHIALDQVRHHIENFPGVREVHDLHIRTAFILIDKDYIELTCHIVVSDLVLEGRQDSIDNLIERLRLSLNENFSLDHFTIQPEFKPCSTGQEI